MVQLPSVLCSPCFLFLSSVQLINIVQSSFGDCHLFVYAYVVVPPKIAPGPLFFAAEPRPHHLGSKQKLRKVFRFFIFVFSIVMVLVETA
jgi:hypothetical protein